MHRNRRQPEIEAGHPLARPGHSLLPCRARLVEDREAVALGVVRALGGEGEARPDQHLEVLLGVGDGLDEGVLEDAHHVADGDAVGKPRLPVRVVAAGELEERVVGRAAV